ncbi:MAG TPA: peptidoglycan-binding domain-containing protein [Aridibacter sp.]|nr:peptidoglycan-binding domain-containing protein [Aridibacter sp.]
MKQSLTILFLTIFLLCGTVAAQNGGSKAFRPVKAQITAAQEKLKSNGSYSGPVDGKYNDGFRDALKEFQAANGLEASGRLDENTLGKMSIELTDRQKGIEAPKGPKRTVFRVNKEQISEAQRLLKSRGKYNGSESGRYSNELRAAIREFQSEAGIRRSGSLNRATLEKMGIELTEAQSAIPVDPKDLEASKPRGSRGPVFRANKEQIANVQEMLKSKGLYQGEATGKLNPETRAAIKSWQTANDVKPTGTLNKETLVAMGIELTDSQKSM